MLKENYHNLGEYDSEDEVFVEYMRCRRKSMNRMNGFFNKVVDVIGCYATKPLRVALTMLLVWLAFGVVFSLFAVLGGLISDGCTNVYWLNGFYFSAVTFLTIGYGDIAPLNFFAKLFASIEGIMGLFLMSYFTVAIVRKTLR